MYLIHKLFYIGLLFLIIVSTIKCNEDECCSKNINRNEEIVKKEPNEENGFCSVNSGCPKVIDHHEKVIDHHEKVIDNNLHNVEKIYEDKKVDTANMVLIEAGTFEMGSNDARYEADKEGPVRNITVKAFYIDKYTVSNTNFETFIKTSGYVTDAEKFGNSFVFEKLLPKEKQDLYQDLRAVQAKWWIKLDGASWKQPEGEGSGIQDRMNHPVTHVSWDDARAYCRYYNKRLPTEEEWEKACRGGLRQKLYPWGNALNAKNIYRANIWHGEFPYLNSKDDGYLGTCPVDSFPPNNFGLFNMVGNVWEWTETVAHINPKEERIKKGGSFLCHDSYCYRYRCAARSHNTLDSSSSNMGFRCVADVI